MKKFENWKTVTVVLLDTYLENVPLLDFHKMMIYCLFYLKNLNIVLFLSKNIFGNLSLACWPARHNSKWNMEKFHYNPISIDNETIEK